MCRDLFRVGETMNPAMSDVGAPPPGFEALYEGTVDRVHSYARTRLGPTEAEDVTSEVFSAALVALRAGRGEAVTEPWLMAVVRNKVIDRWRTAERRMNKRHLLVRPTAPPGPDWIGGGDADQLMAALDRISLRHRGLLMLHYVDGYPMAEVAELLDITLEAARSALARARRALLGAYQEVTLDV